MDLRADGWPPVTEPGPEVTGTSRSGIPWADTTRSDVPPSGDPRPGTPPSGTGPAADGRRPLRVLLVSEGAYPFHPGGVSLWCDQIVRGMPEHTFTVVALTVDGTEPVVWPAPANLTEVVGVPLWGDPPRRSRRARRTPPPDAFTEAHEHILRTLARPPEPGPAAARRAAESSVPALRALHDHARTGDLRAALTGDEALDRMTRVWREAGDREAAGAGPLGLHDAYTAADLMEHTLRPLSHPPVDADVCHLAMNGPSALVGLAAKWAHGTPLVMSEHGVYLRERYQDALGDDVPPGALMMLRFHRALAEAAYHCADVLAPHSRHNRRWQLHGGADPDRIRTMYNGIDPADYPVATGEPDVPTVVYVGRVDPMKDLHTLIRAFALVRDEVPDARLRMFGPVAADQRAYHASCLALIDELGLTGTAVFEGRVPRQVDAYGAGHLTALTSVSEGFPYTVVESMSTARPQVCTQVGGVPEAVGDAGILVPPGDHRAVAGACVRLLRDAGLRRRLGDAARARVLERFTLAQWTDGYRALYDTLVPHQPPPGRRAAGRERVTAP
ncbi:GT4 family glycosyltransferase PelF [Streptomyces sp. NPDC029526]|uniref:GT4 family glycosyltransferase PelF n=1 Tax=Streptomyces sp. NPDC029526 TaxID=3155728 RepID=UPI00340EE4D9